MPINLPPGGLHTIARYSLNESPQSLEEAYQDYRGGGVNLNLSPELSKFGMKVNQLGKVFIIGSLVGVVRIIYGIAVTIIGGIIGLVACDCRIIDDAYEHGLRNIGRGVVEVIPLVTGIPCVIYDFFINYTAVPVLTKKEFLHVLTYLPITGSLIGAARAIYGLGCFILGALISPLKEGRELALNGLKNFGRGLVEIIPLSGIGFLIADVIFDNCPLYIERLPPPPPQQPVNQLPQQGFLDDDQEGQFPVRQVRVAQVPLAFVRVAEDPLDRLDQAVITSAIEVFKRNLGKREGSFLNEFVQNRQPDGYLSLGRIYIHHLLAMDPLLREGLAGLEDYFVPRVNERGRVMTFGARLNELHRVFERLNSAQKNKLVSNLQRDKKLQIQRLQQQYAAQAGKLKAPQEIESLRLQYQSLILAVDKEVDKFINVGDQIALDDQSLSPEEDLWKGIGELYYDFIRCYPQFKDKLIPIEPPNAE